MCHYFLTFELSSNRTGGVTAFGANPVKTDFNSICHAITLDQDKVLIRFW